MPFEIDISDSTKSNDIDLQKLSGAIEFALRTEDVASAVLSVSVVDNATIHRLNREHLQHDYPTDVISFQLDWNSETAETPSVAKAGRSRQAAIEGEVVASVEYAREMASRCGWSVQDELTLYVIHGMLHICGYDDLSAGEKEIMRARERCILSRLGLSPWYPDDVDGETAAEPPEPSTSVTGNTTTEGDL